MVKIPGIFGFFIIPENSPGNREVFFMVNGTRNTYRYDLLPCMWNKSRT
jgi:hypothetical protein